MSFFDYPNEPPASSGNDGLLLADASDEEWATLLAHTRSRRFSPGDAIVTAGAADQSLYLVLEGQLEVLAERGRRGYRRLASVGTGSVIGELSLFDGGRSALVRAVAPAVLAEMSRSESTPSRPRARSVSQAWSSSRSSLSSRWVLETAGSSTRAGRGLVGTGLTVHRRVR